MPSLNRVEIIGHVGAMPELRVVSGGKSVCNFNVACNHYFTGKDGSKRQEVDWFSVVAWGKLAESCNQFVDKGSPVFVSGRVKLHEWDKPDKTRGYRIEIQANSVIFLSRKVDQSETGDSIIPEDEIPFFGKVYSSIAETTP